VWEGTGGWVNEYLFTQLIRVLRQAVRAHRGEDARVLLIVDAATQHISKRALAYAARMRVYLLLIPGQLTWLLQALDVYVFRGFKACLRERHAAQRGASARGVLPKHVWIPLVGNAIEQTIVRVDHSLAFARLGCEVGMPRLRPSVLEYAEPLAELPVRPLTSDELCVTVGRMRVGIEACLFNGPRRIAAERGIGIHVVPEESQAEVCLDNCRS